MKCRLMPYLFGQAVQSHETGVPMMRAMLLEFPDDPACDTLDRQYMLGDSLLVAPVFASDGVVDYYVPAGRWTHFFTGKLVTGPGWVRETHDFLSVPLLARPHSVIPIGSQDSRPDYDFADGVTLRVYELEPDKEIITVIPDLGGNAALTVTSLRTGAQIQFTTQGATQNWQALLVGIPTVVTTSGGTVETTPEGVLLTPSEGASRLVITLEE